MAVEKCLRSTGLPRTCIQVCNTSGYRVTARDNGRRIGFRDVKEEPMPIMIHPDLEERLRARAEAAGVSVETYIERIARDDQSAETSSKASRSPA